MNLFLRMIKHLTKIRHSLPMWQRTASPLPDRLILSVLIPAARLIIKYLFQNCTWKSTNAQERCNVLKFIHTRRHTPPGHCLFSLIWYQREDISKHLIWQLISHIAPGNDYCHKFPPTAHIVIWNILRVVVTLCGVCFVFTSLFWLIWLFSFICILLFCHLRAAEVLHMCK